MAAIRVLVVDDAADLRYLVRRTLEAGGPFNVVGEAGDGVAAVELAQRLSPDIVLLDLAMPAMSGLEALPRLTRAAPDARVVILTGVGHERMEKLTRSWGAVGYLEKGIGGSRLVEELLTVAGLLDAVEDAVLQVRTSLDDVPRSAGAARRFVDAAVRTWRLAVPEELTLLTSEVVTNAIVHGGAPVEVGVRLTPSSIRIEVHDGSVRQPTPRTGDLTDTESGRGLHLVEALAWRWGVEEHTDGKTVWFEVPRPVALPDDRPIR